MERSRVLRSVSPARKATKSPTRKKSPSRKSPARRSPGRQKSSSSPKKSKSSPRKSPSRRASPARNSSISADKIPMLRIEPLKQNRTSPVSSRSSMPVEQKVVVDVGSVSRSTSLEPQMIKSRIVTEVSSATLTKSGDTVLTRRSMRVLSRESDLKREVEENVEKILKANNVPVPVYSDGYYNNTDNYQDTHHERPQREFGGVLGAIFWIIVAPATAVVLQLACTKNTCLPNKLDRLPLNWRYYLKPEIATVYLGFIVWQALLSLLPVGKKIEGLPSKYGTLPYRNNGLMSIILTLAAIGGLYYYGYPVTVYVDKSLQFLSIAIIFGLFLSAVLFIKGGNSPYKTPSLDGNKLYDFWMGRELNPRFGPFDVKILLLRVAVIGCIVFNVLLVLKSIESKPLTEYSPTLLLMSTLQIVYLLDWYLFEKTFLSSFEIQHEAVGYMSAMGYSVWPFVFLLTPKFIYYNRVEAPFYVLIIVTILHNIGYVIYRASNAQKGKFRMNPSDPNLAYLDTIPTSQGRKLLCGGWWGWVRHPNYLGDIIMNWSWAVGCGFSHWLPFVLPIAVTMLLVHRSIRDNARCKARYGTAWDRYTHKVKYHFIPGLF